MDTIEFLTEYDRLSMFNNLCDEYFSKIFYGKNVNKKHNHNPSVYA